MDDYSRAIDVCPDLTVAFYNRGLVLYRLGQHKQAKDDLEVAVNRCPDNRDYGEALQACLPLIDQQ